MTAEEIARLRKDYSLHSLNEGEVASSPIEQFERWWTDVERSQIIEMNAMTLATIGEDNFADARTVLLKGFDKRGFVFFTNYNSAKSRELDFNPTCCLLFHWKELERQVRIKGIAEKISQGESEEYFNTRPEGSKIGAWSSPQSEVVESKRWLEEAFNHYAEKFKTEKLNKPPHWGGFRVNPVKIEFWQGRPNRMHDRILYTETTPGNWKIERLAP
ncbi:MAG TPA: pyridoxamine 5'-phosphate oxidase [Chitinophagaceae bacterium]|nr:pyridoxamine 5'-phosphate oxidase [Chitinophagaceae bacterium]